jgi:hypothetical protein
MIDVLKVHDYNYLRKVIEQAKSLEKSSAKDPTRFGKIIINT